MPSPSLRRTAAVLASVLVLTPVLAACGSSSDKDDDSAQTVGGAAITGTVGKGLNASWSKTLPKTGSDEVTTLVKGKGAKVESGDTASTYIWIGSRSKKKAVYSDYTNGAAEPIPVAQVNGVLGRLFDGATYGSRVATVATAKDVFGSASGNPQLGVSGSDSLVLVADVVKKQEVSPTPSDATVHDAPASSLPTVVTKDGRPSGLDWSGVAKPSLTTPVQRVVLKQGTGAAVKASDTVTVNYLGETYKGTQPFDESYTKQPLSQPLSGLIKGWSIGLTGVKAGSRVLLQIPPAYGYGAQGSAPTIPGNATLWFVIDVVATK